VPAATPVKLSMISEDVIHSLFFPALRIKHDVLPGRYTELWFTADRPGTYHLLCAEFCGTAHSEMGGRIVVMEPAAYEAWLERAPSDRSLAAAGARLFRSFGCSGCHLRSDVVRAPPLEGVFGSPVPLTSGEVKTADEGYLRDSILLPRKDIVAGYQPIMPSFQDRISEGQLVQLIAYLKSLGSAQDDQR
jgi:cytochrome c oxidase subunit II